MGERQRGFNNQNKGVLPFSNIGGTTWCPSLVDTRDAPPTGPPCPPGPPSLPCTPGPPLGLPTVIVLAFRLAKVSSFSFFRSKASLTSSSSSKDTICNWNYEAHCSKQLSFCVLQNIRMNDILKIISSGPWQFLHI